MIYHGHTLTSKINFIDVIRTINEHAFITNEYPIILSVENHCSLPQQRYMANIFCEIFGHNLLSKPLDKNDREMPSPNQLKRKIIIKFIAKKFYDDNNQMEAIFKSNQPSIKGELNIIQHLCLMISANDSNECDELWKLLQPPNVIQSDRYCIEKLGRYFMGLGERRFLFNHPQPQLIDIIIWSLANRSRALRSLMDAKWYKVIESMLMSV